MIRAEITGELPRSDELDFGALFAQASEMMYLDLIKNFEEGGRPERWPAKKTGEASHLFQTGALRESIGFESGDDFASAGAMTLLPYSFVHQYGSPKQNIPQREYILWQEGLIDEIVELFGDSIVEFYDTRGEKVG